jgi:hypothetical protein
MTFVTENLYMNNLHYQAIRYDYREGLLYLVKTNKVIIPDDENKVYFGYDNKRYVVNSGKLCYEILHGCSIPENHRLIFKDLNKRNLKGNNLAIIPSEQYKEVQEALKNLSGWLRLGTHSKCMYSYVLEYRLGGKPVKRVIDDVVIAKRELLKMQLKFTKIVSKYFYLE